MSARRFSRKHRLPSGSLRPQDETGTLFDSNRNDRYERKTRQLCKQVHEALALAMANCRDPLLRECFVEHVEPWPSLRRLRVSVSAEAGANVECVLEALRRAEGYFRSEVSSHISRKRTPTLNFVVVAPEEEVER